MYSAGGMARGARDETVTASIMIRYMYIGMGTSHASPIVVDAPGAGIPPYNGQLTPL